MIKDLNADGLFGICACRRPSKAACAAARTRKQEGLSRTQLIDVAQQLLDAGAHLLTLRAKRFDLAGKFCVCILRLGMSGLRGRELLERGVLLLPQTIDERDRLLDALLEMTQSIDFRFLSRFQLPFLSICRGTARAVLTCAVMRAN